MKLYDEVISKIIEIVSQNGAHTIVPGASDWPFVSERSMILRSDMAYELGADLKPGLGATILTDNIALVPQDEIVLSGADLPDLSEDNGYIRCTLVRVKEDAMGEGNALYNAIRKMEYIRYHFYPEGFMMRMSTSQNKESVRISKKALENGINFAKVGSRMIAAFHENPAVEAVKMIYVTKKDFPYSDMEKLFAQSETITKTIDHMFKDVSMDCDVCNLKSVCDEVEGLRQLHYGNHKTK